MSPNKFPLLIGITGNIGSGKSVFCNFLTAKGLKVISADDIANQHFVYINENSMNEVNLKMTCFYIEIEQIFLELNTKNNKIFSNKLKF